MTEESETIIDDMARTRIIARKARCDHISHPEIDRVHIKKICILSPQYEYDESMEQQCECCRFYHHVWDGTILTSRYHKKGWVFQCNCCYEANYLTDW